MIFRGSCYTTINSVKHPDLPLSPCLLMFDLRETGYFPVFVNKTVVLFVAVSREIISYRHVITSTYSQLQSSLNTFVTDYFLSHVFRRFETAHVHAHASRACELARKPRTFSWVREILPRKAKRKFIPTQNDCTR